MNKAQRETALKIAAALRVAEAKASPADKFSFHEVAHSIEIRADLMHLNGLSFCYEAAGKLVGCKSLKSLIEWANK